MKILLIAHAFPPDSSPQSLRWMYLSRELDLLGHEIHVLTASAPSHVSSVGVSVPGGVRVHACTPGPVHSGLAYLKSRREPAHTAAVKAVAGVDRQTLQLNWKGRLVKRSVALLDRAIFPDIRGEWGLMAGIRLRSLLRDMPWDVVVSSHEPATTLELGLIAKRARFRWVADLGDPVLAPYTPKHWRTRARCLERKVCEMADAIVVTGQGAANLVRERHRIPERKLHVVTQGFDQQDYSCTYQQACTDSMIELFYSGSLYTFRRIGPLLDAIRAIPSMRLTVASSQYPEELAEAVVSLPDRVRYLGFVAHSQALMHQRNADVLVNLGNDNPCQIPGKLFEYLGAGRPILHVCTDFSQDEAATVVSRMQLGLVVENSKEAIIEALQEFVKRKKIGLGFEVSHATVERYGWPALGRHYEAILKQVAV